LTNQDRTQYKVPDSIENLLTQWIRRAREAQFAHYEEGNRLGKANRYIGISVLILSSVVATALFYSLQEPGEIGTIPTFLTGVLSVVAAVLSSLQTFMKFAERAEHHRAAAARYGSIRRELEQTFAAQKEGQEFNSEKLDLVRELLDRTAESCPSVPAKTFQKSDLHNR